MNSNIKFTKTGCIATDKSFFLAEYRQGKRNRNSTEFVLYHKYLQGNRVYEDEIPTKGYVISGKIPRTRMSVEYWFAKERGAV